MSDDFFNSANPFAKLDKKSFANPSSADRTARQKQDMLQRLQKDIPTQNAADDESLFLSAMASIDRRLHASKPRPKQAEADGPSFAEALTSQGISLSNRIGAGPGTKQPSCPKPATAKAAAAPKAVPADDASAASDEAALFAEAMKSVRQLGGTEKVPTPPPAPAKPATRPKQQRAIAETVEYTVSATANHVEGYVKGLDLTLVMQLLHGQPKPEAVIDLHGLNVMQACEQLVNVVRNAYQTNKHCLLVICGRGNNSAGGVGILRDKVQAWLTDSPFNSVVLAFCSAQACDGGAGALYVLLRTAKKKLAPVQWELRPHDSDLYL